MFDFRDEEKVKDVLSDDINDMLDDFMKTYRLNTEDNTEDKEETVEDKTSTVLPTRTYSSYSSYLSPVKNYNCTGKKNQTTFPEFIEICKMSQKELKMFVTEKLLQAGYTDVVAADGYVYAKGIDPVLLTAHLDTVHKELIKDFYEYHDETKDEHIISSPQGIGGDDRCGVYMILEIIKEFRPSILFCEDEEIGGVGSQKFCGTEFIMELSELNYMIELDRTHAEDAVFYKCDNKEFTEFIEENTDYVESTGSFSDISNLAPKAKIAAVNLSCGYYNAHTTSEYVVMEEMFNTITVVKNLLALEDVKQYEYIEKKYTYRSGGYYGGNYYGRANYDYDDYWREYYRKLYDDTEDDNTTSYNGTSSRAVDFEDDEITMEILWYCADTKQEMSSVYIVTSEMEGIGWFLKEHPDLCYNDILDYYVI